MKSKTEKGHCEIKRMDREKSGERERKSLELIIGI